MNKELVIWLRSKKSDKFFVPLLKKMGSLGSDAHTIKRDKSAWHTLELMYKIYMVRNKKLIKNKILVH